MSEKNILRHLYFETILLLQLFFKNAHFRCRLRFLMKHFKFHFSLEEIIKPERVLLIMGTFEATRSGSIVAMSSLLILCSSLANWLSVRLRTKWLSVRIALLSLRYRQP